MEQATASDMGKVMGMRPPDAHSWTDGYWGLRRERLGGEGKLIYQISTFLVFRENVIKRPVRDDGRFRRVMIERGGGLSRDKNQKQAKRDTNNQQVQRHGISDIEA